MKTLIGVDIGTQGTKAALYAEDGRCLATAFRTSKLHRPAAGHVEEDPEDQFKAVCATIAECVKSSGVERNSVAGVAIDGQMAGVLGVGEDGRHVTPYDSWLDTRCGPHITTLADAAGVQILARSGGAPGFNHGPKLLWWKRHRPKDYRRIRAFVQPGGYAVMRLCGLTAADAFIDTTYLHFSAFADNRKGVWDADLAGRFDIDAAKLPRIVQPQEIVGTIAKSMAAKCGLRAGTPVVAGCGDTAASFLAAGATTEGVCVDVSGTASVFAATTSTFRPDPGGTLAVGRSAVPGLWHPYAYINGGGMNLEWFRQQVARFGPASEAEPVSFEALSAAAEKLADDVATHPMFVPHMGGRATPSRPALRGAWVDLDWTHTAAHLYRAIFESVALEYALYQTSLRDLDPGQRVREIRVTGGGAASRLWNTIKADVLQTPVRPVTQSGGAPLGAAMLAGWGVGVIKDLPTAAKTWVRTGPPVKPTRRHAAAYQARARRYAALLDLLDPTHPFKAKTS